ncbi:MAG: hypothetical protein JWQ87_4622 [Candidatus Sulfotelmatobacter sp.]|nr:hypothetical protein [Candidatus Sulfotelmatobacter sp.]
MSRGVSISTFTQRIALRIRTYSLEQRICFQIIQENTGFLRLVPGLVGNSSINRPRPPTDSYRETTGKVRFARDPEVDAGTVASLADGH